MGLKPFHYTLCVTPNASQRIANLTERDVILHALDEERHQVLGSFGGIHQLAPTASYVYTTKTAISEISQYLFRNR